MNEIEFLQYSIKDLKNHIESLEKRLKKLRKDKEGDQKTNEK